MKKTVFKIILIFIIAFIFRIYFLSGDSLTFGYDQARDAYVAQQILGGDFKILGPPASVPGLYHGVFYYYFLAIPYIFGKSPIIAAYWLAIFNAAVVFMVFYLTKLITKKNSTGLLAAMLFAISFEATQYATWLSNPTIGVFTVPLIYLGLWMWLKEKRKWGPIVCALGLGLSIQANIFLLYHAVPVILWLTVEKKNIKKEQFLKFFVFLFLALSTLFLSEIKFGFKSVSGIRQLFMGNESNLAYAKSLGDYLLLYLNQTGRIFAFNSFPVNIGLGGAFIYALIFSSIFSLKNKKGMTWGTFLASWLFSHLTVVSLGGISTPFLMVGIGPAVSILIAVYISKWWKQNKKVLSAMALTILVIANISFIFKENQKGSTLFAIQKDMLLSKQLKVLEYTYEQSNGEDFSLNTLTSPLWINIVWTYLYEAYGLPKYGYLPCYSGQDQIGQLKALPTCENKNNNHFLILEPMGGIPERYLDETLGQENEDTVIVDEKYFGELRVQKRAVNKL